MKQSKAIIGLEFSCINIHHLQTSLICIFLCFSLKVMTKKKLNTIQTGLKQFWPAIDFYLQHIHLNLKIYDCVSFQVISKRHYSTVSDADKGILFADRNVINKRNATADVHSNWAHCKAFAILEMKARIIAAAVTVLGMQNINDEPKHNPYISLKHGTDQEKKHYLMKISGQIVDQFVLDKHALNSFLDSVLSAQEQDDIVHNQNLTPDGRFPCRQPGCNKSFKHDGKRRRDHEQTHDPPPMIPEKTVLSATYPQKALSSVKGDDVFGYNCSLLSQGLLFMDFLDATSEGEGERSIRCWKFFLLHFKEEKSTTKYALEALYLLLQVHSLLPPAEAHSFLLTTKGTQERMLLLILTWNMTIKILKHLSKILGQMLKRLQ